MKKQSVAKELLRIAREMAGANLDLYAVITIGNGRVSFQISSEIDRANLKTGSEPFLNEPMKAIDRVFNLVRKSGVAEHMVEVLTR